jgi:hypothetical protein
MSYFEKEAAFRERYFKSITSNEFLPRYRRCSELSVIDLIKLKKCRETARSRSVLSFSSFSSSFPYYAETGFLPGVVVLVGNALYSFYYIGYRNNFVTLMFLLIN